MRFSLGGDINFNDLTFKPNFWLNSRITVLIKMSGYEMGFDLKYQLNRIESVDKLLSIRLYTVGLSLTKHF